MSSEEHGDERAPLIPKLDPRKIRKDLIKKLTTDLSKFGKFPAGVSLAYIQEYLSVSDIKRLMRLEYGRNDPAFTRIEPIPAYVFFLTQRGLNAVSLDGSYTYEKILTAFAEDAQRHYKKNSGDFENNIKDNVLFFVFDKSLSSIKWYSWYKRRQFCSPKNNITRLVLAKIEPHLRSREVDVKNFALTRLEKLPQELIARVLETNESYKNLNANELKNFPSILLGWSKCRTAVYQKSLKSKNIGKFTGLVGVTNDIEILEDLIRQLVHKINTSFFKGTYEDMMEACLVKLMKLSNPKEGLELAPELLKQCLRIINNYKLPSNRKKFFNYNFRKLNIPSYYYFMLAYVRRTVPRFYDYPKLQEFIQLDYSKKEPLTLGFEIYSKVNKAAFRADFEAQVGYGRFVCPQDLLLDIAKKPNEFHTYTAFAQDLVETYGADLDFTDGVRASFFEAALIRLYVDSEMWNFYLSKTPNHEEVLSKVIDIFVEKLTGGDVDVPNACIRVAIRELITRFNPVKLTDEMMDKVRKKYDPEKAHGEEVEIFDLLSRQLAAQRGECRASSSNNNNNNNGSVFDPFAAVPAPSAVTSVRRDMEAVVQPVPVKVSAVAAQQQDSSDGSEPLKRLQEILDNPEAFFAPDVNAAVLQAGSAVKHLTPVQVRELSRKYQLLDRQFDILNEHIPYYRVFDRLARWTYGFAEILLSVLKNYYKEGEEGDTNKKAAEALIQVSTAAEKQAFLKLIDESIKGKDKASEIIAAINSNNADPEVIKKLVEYLHNELRSSEQAVAVQAIVATSAREHRRNSSTGSASVAVPEEDPSYRP